MCKTKSLNGLLSCKLHATGIDEFLMFCSLGLSNLVVKRNDKQ